MSFSHNDVRILPLYNLGDVHEVQLWYVTGIPNVYYPTKLAAEAAAMLAFPDTNYYSRIFFRTFYSEQFDV